MIPKYIDKSKLSQRPGVYQFKDSLGNILYVGKAINLYHRVASYFSKDVIGRTAELVSRIAGIETIIVESELEALILEANLIKKFLPPFNIRLIDDKDYLYIGLTKEDFPKVKTYRKQDLKVVKKFWGPFPSSRTVRDTLKQLRRVFPWCSNPPRSASQGETLRVCFYHHLDLCPGACAGQISKEDYNKILRRFSNFLDGKKDELIEELTSEMQGYAQKQQFERAQVVKRVIEGVLYLTQTQRVKNYLENPNFLEDEKRLALLQLQKDLKLAKLPERIEGYDISNIQGEDATGSMVVLTNGEIDKSQYRKFKIHIAGKPNDVGMHKEMMNRRLKHPEWPLPDLIIVDGGCGQARAVKFEILNLKFEIPVFGLAKNREWLYPPEREAVKLPRRSLSLKLLQKLRDESHRFAINYHRKLRDRTMIPEY
ncbi:hypothetical protein A3C26_01705 [Candidatus Daviesbacteria bacterium RIFCSPHIGHO2_02_FULL_39_12]|uniref:Excinuclease ABC subunit C n=2 Tax=Candidatus Daviesiibacteriota TaxID=1752718 RepID=A0A1F5JAR7_9BACT|nr:MAG: hypothetical protein A3C26_01705 [Candidatus Daviesbacteria bacterium RIFCSPHIGHO2_02_FULL_39_12]OGE72689.1 MAG: hypothetical protein A3H40_00030 [Candidatus Daviesbacteria bacterium RIFCSPLOWO2_02_FULL_38_15]